MPLKFVEFSPKFDYRVALLLLSLEQQLASADFPIAIFGHCTTTREIDATLWRGEVCLGSWGPLVYLYHVIYYRHSTSLGAQVLELWKEGGARLHATFFKILQFFFCCILPRVKPFIVERGNGKNHRSDRRGGAGRPIIPTSSRHLRCNARCYANVRLWSHNSTQPSRSQTKFFVRPPPLINQFRLYVITVIIFEGFLSCTHFKAHLLRRELISKSPLDSKWLF